MGIFDAIKGFFQSTQKAEERKQREDALRTAIKTRCGHFKSLLAANKRALVTMANLEEAMRGEQFFSLNFVRANCTTVLTNVFNMVRHLNGLAENSYNELFDRHKIIQHRIGDIINPKQLSANGPLVIPLEDTGFSLAHEVGGKMASLGEAWQHLGQHIPDGFVITASAFQRFLEANDLQEEINRHIQMTDMSKLDAIFGLSSTLQQLVIAAPVPDDLAEAIQQQYELLLQNSPQESIRLAVRSSAIGEDSAGASFAGQYRSELNVTGENLLDTYKEVISSKYGVTAMTYRVKCGIPDDEVPMCVGCLVMIDALSGGVAYSSDPLSCETGVVINAVPGLPKAVVDGSSPVDVFRVSREVPLTIVERDIAEKKSRLACATDEGVLKTNLSAEEQSAPSITDEQVLEVARVALAFEDFYGTPQDVEWAFSQENKLIILQSRALPGMNTTVECLPPPEGVPLLLSGGICASDGVAAGPVCIVRRDADMLRFPQGAILVVEQAHARWAPVLGRASAVISELGGAAGHLASVSREYGIPALFGLTDATKKLTDNTVITVDATTRNVFAGRVEEVLERRQEPRLIFSGSPVHKVLTQAAEHIVPLHLLDPDAPEFVPASCETLHDITRFCHEKSVEEMFRMDDSLFSNRFGKQLSYKGSKLQYFVVNIENGFHDSVKGNTVELSQISCPPMHAIWEGMVAIPWHGPRSTTARGFLAVVAESASNPELEITSSSTRLTRNYFMVDREYCNLQASFGYHFCTIEAQAGEVDQENYVNFHFKGGAANLARRQLRIDALAEVLLENGFFIEVRGDTLAAWAEDLSAGEAHELLYILGFLLIHTRQMDASLSGEESRIAFADSLRKGVSQVIRLYQAQEKTPTP